MLYANQAGTSWPKAPGVVEAVADALSAAPGGAGPPLESVAERLCAFLGAPDPDRFVFTPGCTAALATVMADLPWRAGDVLITSSLEHHALSRPIELLARDRGVVVARSPYRPGTPIDLDFVRDTLRGGGVRLVAVTAASNVTGELLPLEPLAGLAHEYGALMLADLAQVAGIVPIDVQALGLDIAVIAGHKGLLSPHGVGGFWAARPVRFESPWATCEIGERQPCNPFPGYCDVGGVNSVAVAGLAASLGWIEAEDLWPRVARAREQARGLRESLRRREGCTVYGSEDASLSATVSFCDAALPIEDAEQTMRERGVLVRAGQHCAPWAHEAIGAAKGTVRISFGALGGDDDADTVLAALPPAASNGR